MPIHSTSNWFAAGCGFVFHHTSATDEYLVFLSLDGYVESVATHKGHQQYMGDAYYEKLQIPAGKAHIVLVVNGNQFAFFVQVHQYRPVDSQGIVQFIGLPD
jgi:hypothetical protein